MANAVPIPEPPGYPLIGNIAEFSPENPLGDLLRLADTYGALIPHCRTPFSSRTN
jgi:cytochrome P450 / NADPH-cytochrome P450 reductase